MSTSLLRPAEGHFNYGAYGNVPIFQDASTVPVVSPLTGNAELLVHAGALRLWIRGTYAIATKKGAVTSTGNADTLIGDGWKSFDCAGMNSVSNPTWPEKFVITTAGAEFYFDCVTPDGL